MLDGRDDGETLRRLARLRGLLLARSGLDARGDRPDQRGHQGDLVERRRVGASFGPGSGGDAGLRAFPRNLVLTVHDEAGWLSSVGDLAEGPVSTILTDARFDQIENDHDAHCLRLVKRFTDRSFDLARWREGRKRFMSSFSGDETPGGHAARDGEPDRR